MWSRVSSAALHSGQVVCEAMLCLSIFPLSANQASNLNLRRVGG
jgi:hypothetical protein